MKNKGDLKYFTGIRATKLPPPFPAYYGNDEFFFVSYAHKDCEDVFPILEKLSQNGILLWYDEGLQAGKDWFEYMRKKINRSAGFLVFLSTRYIDSPHAMKEFEFALEKKKKIIPIKIQDVQIPSKIEEIFLQRQITCLDVNDTNFVEEIRFF